MTLITVICRNSVTPPELSGNTPVPDIFQPVKVDLIKTFRNEFQLAGFQCLDCRFCHLFHLYEPLLFYHWLYCSLTAVMGTNCMSMGNHLNQKSQFLQVLYNGLSGFITIHTVILASCKAYGSIIVHYCQFRQLVSSSNFKVVRVMSRSDLNASGTEFFINIGICNHWNLSSSQGKC